MRTRCTRQICAAWLALLNEFLIFGSAYGAAPDQIAAVLNAMSRHYCADKGSQYGALLAEAIVSNADLQDRYVKMFEQEMAKRMGEADYHAMDPYFAGSEPPQYLPDIDYACLFLLDKSSTKYVGLSEKKSKTEKHIGSFGRISMSLPIFSKDAQSAMVVIANQNNDSAFFFLKRRGGDWLVFDKMLGAVQ